ncbi:MAG: hypothetical protein A3B10_00260 [Candidatus Doudnabacteria bacterium RIFCSPLOWO2_01_FULL_44_21]|uniref:Bifunctional protein FolD n=1 Tax=Candidatus Doudnabacteria bacterium RIFCSPLOWO2_01_FULL_44_21 TaxID=1817841 RepID=A0A1F5PYC1_9BACT|nr:MAG: hypothetical protein A3B95_03715 [Candidatus Doudnabacteria bacterium RIFCSPHIGHO2_02_FULL_43_13b]OGE94580.1 MAG: hypothetical protein A3B10_00260 [Candidatus Doudnabacteria bacterium RIFCSPLOWO2_01_FULL_44_21]
MSIIVDGNRIAKGIFTRLRQAIAAHHLRPHLAVVLVGSDPASQTYVRKKQEAAGLIGIEFSLFKYDENISTQKLVNEIRRIQTNPSLSGIIVQLPLPKTIDKRLVLNTLKPELDVDYLSWESLGKLVIGENSLVPPTPGAILEVLHSHKVPLIGKHVVLVGSGDLIGKPLTNLLIQMPLTLTVCNKETKNLAALTKQADILITGAGIAGLIKARMLKRGVVVVDAGVSFRKKKIFGDVKFEEVRLVASLITPTPGGVGPITVAKLLENTIINAKAKNQRSK